MVGATNIDGSRWTRAFHGSNYDEDRGLPHVHAPGFTDMECAGKGRPGDPYKLSDGGTSMSTASVAGLAAYFLAHPSAIVQSLIKKPQLMKSFIISKAWARPDTTILSVYNNYKFVQADLQCPIRPRNEQPAKVAECSERPATESAKSSQAPSISTSASTKPKTAQETSIVSSTSIKITTDQLKVLPKFLPPLSQRQPPPLYRQLESTSPCWNQLLEFIHLITRKPETISGCFMIIGLVTQP